MQESVRSEQSERQSGSLGTHAVTEVELTDRERAFVTAYTSGKTKWNATQSYMVAYPNASELTAGHEGYEYLKKPQIGQMLASFALSARISPDWVLQGLYEEGERKLNTKRKRTFNEDGVQVGETIEETDHDRVPALSLAAELTGQKRNVTTVALAVSVTIGGIDD